MGINEGFFLLAFGAILLALLTSMVSKATAQFFHDQGAAEKCNHDEEDSMYASNYFSRENEDGERIGGIGTRIHLAPVLFTDTFRWLLYQENNRWDLPDAHYHWGAVANNPSRAMFLPEARVLTTEPGASPSQYPKMKYVDAKMEPAESIIKKEHISFNGYKAKTGLKTSPSKEFNGLKPNTGLKTTGLPPKESFQNFSSNEINDDETNSLTSEDTFQDETPMQQVRQGNTISLFHPGCGCYQTMPIQFPHLQVPPSTPGLEAASRQIMPIKFPHLKAPPSTTPGPEAASRRMNITSENTVTSAPSEMEYEYDFETVVSNNDEMSMSEYDEQTINTGYEEYTVVSEVIEEELEDVISSYDQTSGVRFLD